MSTVPRRKSRSEYQGAYKDLQEQIDELRRKIEEIQSKDARYARIFDSEEPLPRGCSHAWIVTTGGHNVCQYCGAYG